MMRFPSDAILSFTGLHRFLSNYYHSPITLHGPQFREPITFPTVEHAFAAMKTLDHDERARIAALPTPGDAKKAGRSVTLRPGWDEMRIDVMRHLLRAKFEQNPLLRDMLLNTGDRVLVEGNTWKDLYWGVDIHTLEGENWLGRLLVEERAYCLSLRAADIGSGPQLGLEGLSA